MEQPLAGSGSAAEGQTHHMMSEISSVGIDQIEMDLLLLQDACWDLGKSLRFQERRIERRYCEDLYLGRRRVIAMPLLFFSAYGLGEMFLIGAWGRLGGSELAALITAVGRLVSALQLFLAGALTLSGVAGCESQMLISLFMQPLLMFVNNGFRMSSLLNSSWWVDEYTPCSAFSCTDDSHLILVLLIAASAPLMLSIRFVYSWMVVPWMVALYTGFSISGLGPLSNFDVMINSILLLSIGLFLMLGTFRVEGDRRRRWTDNMLLRMDNAVQRMELYRQRQFIKDVEERLDALGSLKVRQNDEPPVFKGGSTMHLGSRATLTVPAPEVRDCLDRDTEAIGPNEVLVSSLAGRCLDAKRLRKMATSILDDESYGLRQFFDDAVATFPELELFFVVDDLATSGVSSGTEYQRTIGALFAVYWLLRLEIGGKEGFAFGYDDDWKIEAAPSQAEGSKSSWTKRLKFYAEMQWGYMQEVVDCSVGRDVERVEAMLCLTAFHDIMKVAELCPTVVEEHAPYAGHLAGERVHDHDLALAYVLEHYPSLLPSYRDLPQASRDVILFTQGKMHFNHGWFVQAEAPAHHMLSKFKSALSKASPSDLSFYFLHWLTDLSGAEGRPLGGAEKFVLKFPQEVLASFLWSIPFLQHLTEQSETEVVERYLAARFKMALKSLPLPTGEASIAIMRLVVMSQSVGHLVPECFDQLPPRAKDVLTVELARTGSASQTFQGSPQYGGPALFIYYGPALMQRCTSPAEMANALRMLALVYGAARRLFPLSDQQHAVTLDGGMLKAHAGEIVQGSLSFGGKILMVERRSNVDGVVSLVGGSGINARVESAARFVALDREDLEPVEGAEPPWSPSAVKPPLQSVFV